MFGGHQRGARPTVEGQQGKIMGFINLREVCIVGSAGLDGVVSREKSICKSALQLSPLEMIARGIEGIVILTLSHFKRYKRNKQTASLIYVELLAIS